jgi:hypothetical protein
MRLELGDGEMLELPDYEARALYETLLARAPTWGDRCCTQARSRLAWSSGARTKIAFDHFETEAVQAVREDKRPG